MTTSRAKSTSSLSGRALSPGERSMTREYQAKLIKEFDEKFGRPYEFIRCVQNEENFGVHRVSRFERI